MNLIRAFCIALAVSMGRVTTEASKLNVLVISHYSGTVSQMPLWKITTLWFYPMTGSGVQEGLQHFPELYAARIMKID